MKKPENTQTNSCQPETDILLFAQLLVAQIDLFPIQHLYSLSF